MIYKGLSELELRIPIFYSGNKPEDLRIFLISESEEIRRDACDFTKRALEELLESSKSSGEIQEYEVQVINLAQETDKSYTDYCSKFWERMGNKEGIVFIPLFHNADSFQELPQLAFDNLKPGIFSVSREGYDSVVNISKRNCFYAFIVD